MTHFCNPLLLALLPPCHPVILPYSSLFLAAGQHLGVSNSTTTMEEYNVLRDKAIQALHQEPGFLGYQDFTVVRDEDGAAMVAPTILALLQFVTWEAKDRALSSLACTNLGFLLAFLAVDITASYWYDGNATGEGNNLEDIEDLNDPFQALGSLMVHNTTGVTSMENFNTPQEDFVDDLVNQTGVIKAMILPSPEEGTTMTLVVYSSLESFDNLFASGHFNDAKFLTLYLTIKSIVGVDTDVGHNTSQTTLFRAQLFWSGCPTIFFSDKFCL